MEKKYDILTVGLQVIDLLVDSVDHGILKRDITTVNSVTMGLGGDALNQAIAAGRLGARTALMGPVGNDAMGAAMLALLAEKPVTVLASFGDAGTGVSVVLLEENRERHFLFQPGVNNTFSYRDIDEEAVKNAAVVSIGGSMAMPGLDGEGTIRLLDLANQSGAITAMDFRINRRDYNMELIWEAIRRSDYILPSEVEASWLTGEEEPERMAEALHKKGVRNCVIKLGGKGCYLSADNKEGWISPYPCRCIDTTGAGDTFTGAFLYGKAKGWDTEACVRFGNAAGSIAVEHLGANTAIQSLEQVLERMHTTEVIS